MIATVGIVLLVLNIYKKRNKTIFLLSVFFMWTIMTFITGNADEGVYLSRYNNASDWVLNSELLFQYLNVTCHKLGLSFLQYKGILAFIYMSLIGSTIWRLSKYPNLVLVFFFICPFPLNVSQCRFALATAIFTFGYKYLFIDYLQEKKRKLFYPSDLKFFLLVIIATLIHTVALFWLTLLFIRRLKLNTTLWFTIGISLFFYFVFNPSLFSWLFYMIGASERINAYFSIAYKQSEFSHFGATSVTVIFIATIAISACILCKKKSPNRSKCIDELLKINIFMISVLAFIFRFTPEMYRPQEGIMLLNYIVILNEIPPKSLLKLKCRQKDMLIQLLLVLLVVGSFVLKILLFNSKTVWNPMFFI